LSGGNKVHFGIAYRALTDHDALTEEIGRWHRVDRQSGTIAFARLIVLLTAQPILLLDEPSTVGLHRARFLSLDYACR
jgi:hypothetical protein